jgi:hypothetical protein
MHGAFDDATLPEIGITDINEKWPRTSAEKREKLFVREGRGLEHSTAVH